MRASMVIGLLLLIVGLVALASPVISYTKTDKVVDLGPVEVTTQREKHIPVPPILGGVAAIAGVAIMVAGNRKA